MKKTLIIIMLFVSIKAVGQITAASYTNKGATVPFINASSYKLNGVTQTFSQWITSSNNIYYNSGNVGIATTTPAYSLDVNGIINSNYLFVSQNIGIGNTLPTYKLDVTGSINGSSYYLNGVSFPFTNWNTAYGWGNHAGLYKSIGDSINLSGFATNYKFNQKQDLLISGTNIKTINSTSLLGSGNISINSSQWVTSGNYIYYNVGAVGITSNTSPLPNFYIRANEPIIELKSPSSTEYYMSVNSSNIFEFSNAVANQKFRFTGLVGIKKNPTYNLDVSGDINADSIFINGSKVRSSQWGNNGNKIYYNTDNVGVGNSDPSYKLDVNGSINGVSYYMNGVSFQFSDWNTAYSWGNHAGLYKGIGDSINLSGFATNYALKFKSYWIKDTYGVSYLNGNVGIGAQSNNFSALNIYKSNISNILISNQYQDFDIGVDAISSYINSFSGPTSKPFDIYNGGTITARFSDNNRLGVATSNPLYTLDVIGTTRFGTSSNYTSTESDGTLVFTGDATVYKDAIVNFIYSGGTGEAKLDTYIGGVKQLKFLTNDLVYLSNTEAPHDWDEASAIELHLHWMVKNALIAGDKVRWQLEYAVANIVANGNTNTLFCDPANPTVFGSRTVTVEYTAPVGGIPAGTHLYTTFETVTPTDFKIGAGFIGTLTRIAKTAGGTDPTTGSIFASNVGIHYKANTIGSRTASAK